MIGRFLMAALLSATLTVSPPTDTGAPEVSGAGGGDDQQQSQEVTDNADDGGLIVLPGDDLSSSSVDSSDDSIPAPGLDPGAGEDSQGDVIDESVSDSTGDTVVIISPDDLAAILQSADSISLFSDYGTADNSLPSGNFLTYAQGLADRVPWGQHYVCWRDDGSYNSTQYFAYGDLSEDSGQFTGSVQVCEYYYVSSQSGYRLSWSTDNSFSLDGSNGFVYSDLGNFPALNGGETFEEAALFLLGFDIVLGLVLSILLGRYTRV